MNKSGEASVIGDEQFKVSSSLNPAQLAAVTHGQGPLLVLAGAGSGKTRVLTHRITHLISNGIAQAHQILAVTFTNKAADEMKHRLRSLLGDQGNGLWVSTFHSACLRILRQNGSLLGFKRDFVIYDDQNSTSLMKKLMKEARVDEKKHTHSFFLGCIDRWKNDFISPSQAASIKGSFNLSIAADLYYAYQKALFQSQAMDFGDLLFKAVELLTSHTEILDLYRRHLHYILVDEFQDTNKVQYLLLKLLAEPRRNILVVGDDDQSIYSFRGAEVSTIINFDRDFPDTKVVVLDQNYRSTSSILRAANCVIAKNIHRKKKRLWTEEEKGDPINLLLADDETEEAEYVASSIATIVGDNNSNLQKKFDYSSIAVFYRTNAQSRAIEEALLGAGIPYRIFGGLKFYDRKEIRDIIAYLRILINPYDSQSVLRVINTPPRGIGVSTVANVEALATSEGINLVEAARRVAKGSKALGKFVELYDHLSSMADILPLSNLIKEIIEASGYLARLESIGGDEAQSRIENLVELQVFSGRLDLAGETPRETIGKFLDKASLSSSAEQPANESTQESVAPAIGGTVSLTTLHLAKGLEFPIVFLTGMEEGLIPHYRSLQDPTAIEEERRLCYVGITRAMQQLTISRCENREMFSSGGGFGTGGGYRTPSRFLRDIPTDVINLVKNWGRNSSYRYHPIEEDDGGYRETTFSKSRSSSSNISLSMVKGTNGSFLADNGATRPRTDLIQCADALATEDTRPFLSAEETVVGMKVYHPTFGSGTLLDIEGDLQKKPESARIMVDFEKTAGKKRLILKYARLRIVSEP